MKLLPIIAIAAAFTLSSCAAHHEVINIDNQKPGEPIDQVSSIELSSLTGRPIDGELLTMEHFQFSENGRKNLLQFRAWEDEQWEEELVIALSDTQSGEVDVQYDPDEVFGMQHHDYWTGFLDKDHFFIYGQSSIYMPSENTPEHPTEILHIYSLGEPDQVQRFQGSYGGRLTNERFVLGEYALDWRTGETYPAPTPTGRDGKLTSNNWFYFSERNGRVHRFHLLEQRFEYWSTSFFSPLPSPTADESHLVVVGDEGECVAWKVTQKWPVGRCKQSGDSADPNRHFSMHPESNLFAIAAGTSVFLYQLEPFGIVTEFDVEEPIHRIGLTKHDRLVITTFNEIQVWNLSSRSLVARRPYRSPDYDLFTLSSGWNQYISGDGQLLAIREENDDGEPVIGIYRIP